MVGVFCTNSLGAIWGQNFLREVTTFDRVCPVGSKNSAQLFMSCKCRVNTNRSRKSRSLDFLLFLGNDCSIGAFEHRELGRSAQIRTNSTDCRHRWLLLGRERPQGAAMTAKSVLNSSVCVSVIVYNVPVVVTGIHMGNVGKNDFVSANGMRARLLHGISP